MIELRPSASSSVPDVVDRVRAALGDARQRRRQHDQRQHAQRQVHVEDRAPRDVRGHEPAEQRAGHRRDAEDRAEQPGVAPAVRRRHDVPDRRLRADHQPAAAEPLDEPERDQLGHPLRQPAQRRAGQEQHQRALQHDLAPVEIAELAVQRRDRGHRQQVRRDDPREVLEPAELLDDRRQRGRHDRLIQRREQHHQHQAADHHQDAAVIEGFGGHQSSATRDAGRTGQMTRQAGELNAVDDRTAQSANPQQRGPGEAHVASSPSMLPVKPRHLRPG